MNEKEKKIGEQMSEEKIWHREVAKKFEYTYNVEICLFT